MAALNYTVVAKLLGHSLHYLPFFVVVIHSHNLSIGYAVCEIIVKVDFFSPVFSFHHRLVVEHVLLELLFSQNFRAISDSTSHMNITAST